MITPSYFNSAFKTCKAGAIDIYAFDGSDRYGIPRHLTMERCEYLNKIASRYDVTLWDETFQAIVAFVQSGPPSIAHIEVQGGDAFAANIATNRSLVIMSTMRLRDGAYLSFDDMTRSVLLGRIWDLASYHWRTPKFVDLCKSLRLDPTWGTPRFLDGYDCLGWSLVEWLASNPYRHGELEATLNGVVLDATDFIRTDSFKTAVDQNKLRHDIVANSQALTERRVPDLTQIVTLAAR